MARTSENIQIAAPNVMVATVHLKGITPILTNRFSEEAIEAIADKQTKKHTTQAARDPEAEFLAARYLMNADHAALKDPCGVPAIGIKKMLVTAGKRFTPAFGTVLNGAFNIPAELVEIKTKSQPQMHTARVVLSGMGKKTSIAYRPQFWPWTMEIPIRVNVDIISMDQIANLFSIAGQSVGIGSWRIDQSGTFGQFEVESVK